jgi:acyl-coenzyme A thioesterase PaaI-like protein
MAMADAAMYALMLAQDEANLSSVTKDFQIHFLSRPAAQDLTALASMIKDSSKHALMRVEIFSAEKLVAHATGSYAKLG